jgi:hypothetical protein
MKHSEESMNKQLGRMHAMAFMARAPVTIWTNPCRSTRQMP